ncbi:MAG TPA: hypothetical protein VEK39_05070 [Solirubrobacterales bacterium]|nr:hypothetical protein [Solirubrobacterales bacterium]
MDIGQVPRGALIAGISGVALFIIMFFSWFGAPEANIVTPAGGIQIDLGEVPGADTTANAWQSFDFIDIVLLVTVIVAVGLAVMSAMGSSVNLPVAASALTAGLGILATLLVLYRIIDPPSDADREFGVFLGLIACAGIAVGGWLSMQEEGTSFGAQADRFGGGPSDPGAPPPPPAGGTGTGAPPPPPPPSQGP